MRTIELQSDKHSTMLDITAAVQREIPESFSGICHIFCNHTTAGLTINENADPDVRHDILANLEQLIPWQQPYFRHFEGNSAAHLKASLLGFSLTVPVDRGRLTLGTWQGIYFCEFDGPRRRQVSLQLIPGGEQ